MAAVDPADAVQAGVFALLNGDAALKALVSGVYDGVPEANEPPYVVIGEMTSIPDGVQGIEGRQTSAAVHSWSRSEGFKTVNSIGGRVVALLTHRHAALGALVAGHVVWRVEHEFGQTLDDPEPGIRHRIDRFRIWTAQEA